MDDTLVVTPGGPRLRSTVHLVQPNTTPIVATRVATSLTKSKIAGRPEAANWITAAWLDMTGATVTSFSTNWTVPPGPSQQSSQLLYLFSGMQPTLASTILQPVLQWGGTASDEDGQTRVGQFWTAASWIVPAPDGETHHTPHVRVNPGDILVGLITLLNKSPAGCTYTCEFAGLAGTRFVTPVISELVWCVETLEAYELGSDANPPYDLNSASEYPAAKSTAFKAINISASGTPQNSSWLVKNYVTNYGEQSLIVADSSTNGEIDIFYSTQTAATAGSV